MRKEIEKRRNMLLKTLLLMINKKFATCNDVRTDVTMTIHFICTVHGVLKKTCGI